MYLFLLALMMLLAAALIIMILLQAGKGGGLSSTFGGASSSTNQVMGGRQAANLLERMTWMAGGVFLFLGLVLSILSVGSTGQQSGRSLLEGEMGTSVSPTLPSQPTSVLETERDQQADSVSARETSLPLVPADTGRQ